MAYNQSGDNFNPNADGQAPSMVEAVGSLLHGYNGVTFDRVRMNNAFVTPEANPDKGLLAVMQPDRRYLPQNLATALNSTIVFDTNGADAFTFVCRTTTTGSFIFEAMADDGTTWYGAEARQSQSDAWVTGYNNTPVSGTTYRVFTMGVRQVRVRTTAVLGAAVSFYATSSARVAWITSIKIGNAPHNIGYSLVHKDVEYTTAQTGTAIWTPAAGRKFVVTDLTIATGGTTAGVVTLWQGAAADTTYNAGTDPAIFRGEFAPSTTAKPGMVKCFNKPFVATTADHILRITTSAAITLYIQIEGYEI